MGQTPVDEHRPAVRALTADGPVLAETSRMLSAVRHPFAPDAHDVMPARHVHIAKESPLSHCLAEPSRVDPRRGAD